MMMEKTARNGRLILPFLEAAAKGDEKEIIRCLLIDRRLINTPHPGTGNTALIVAAEKKRSKVIAILLKHGADVTLCNSANQTAVHVAEDAIRAQLMSAVTRTSYPQLSVLQAAWQGDLGRIQHLLSTGHSQYVHTRNGQGLTPVMLVLRDVDLFVSVTMRHDYRPVDVLQELLNHNVDTALLDYGGRSAVSFLSEVKSPLRRQLTDALERWAPPTDAHGEASSDLCLDTKPPLHDAAPAGVYSSAIPKENSRMENFPSDTETTAKEGASNKNPKLRSDRISRDILEENLDTAADLQKQQNLDQERKGKRQWFTDPPTPEHLTLGSAMKRSLQTEVGEEVSKTNPLRDVRDIKGRIWKRLSSDKSSKDSQTSLPITQSPQCRSSMPATLKPLSKSSIETNRSNTALSPDNLVDSRSKDSRINLDNCLKDNSSLKNANNRSWTGFGRHETTEEREKARIPMSCRDPKSLLEMDEHGEGFTKSQLSEMEKEDPPANREVKKIYIFDKNKVTEEILWTATVKSEDTKKKVELKNMDSSKTPRTSHSPNVHVMFSEQEPVRESNDSSSKLLFTKRKTKLGSIPNNVNHSNNILTQKKNVKTTKNRMTRNTSALDKKKTESPLSKSNQSHGKNIRLPALMPSASKVPKKVSHSAQGRADKSIQPSRAKLSLHPQKRMNSPSNDPILPILKSSHNFQNIKYNDMFAELSSQQGTGPVMFQMFPPSVYVSVSNSRRETNSASTTSSNSSKGSRVGSSRDSSATPELEYKNTPSTMNHCHSNSSPKQEGTEEGQNETESMVTCGMEWAHKTQKQGGVMAEFPLNGKIEPKQHNYELNTISEASIEYSNTIGGSIKEILKIMIEVEKRSSNMGLSNPKNVDCGFLKEVSEMGQQDIGLINSSSNRDTDNIPASKTGSVPPPSEYLHSTKIFSQFQQGKAFEAWVDNDNYQRDNPVESINKEVTMSTSQNIQGSHSPVGQEHLTAYLTSCLENLAVKESTGSQDGEQGTNIQDVDEHRRPSSIPQVSVHTNHSNPTADQSGLHPNKSSIHWIKGEVLGRGAFGMVYRGLTSQGELIAAKQVILHVSDPEVFAKQYKKLQEEVDLLKTLKHPNIVEYLGTSYEDPVLTIFMEFVPGGSLSSNLRQFGPLGEELISKYTSHILQGISYLHSNRVVHRDIKGNNVMLMPKGVIKLIDFGCAKSFNSLSNNGTPGEMLHSLLGTPHWMAPEVISECGHGTKSDIWSIGCTVYEMATGKPPLAHMNGVQAMCYIVVAKGPMPALPDHFSGDAREFVNLCFTRDQHMRPSAEQLLQHAFVQRHKQWMKPELLGQSNDHRSIIRHKK